MKLNNFHKFQKFRKFSNLFSQIWLKIDRRHSFLEFGAKSGKKFIKNSQKNAKFGEEFFKKTKSLFFQKSPAGGFFLWTYCIFSANFWWIFFRISRQIPENSDVCRFLNQICENKSEICRKFWILWNYVNASIPKEKTGYYLFLKVTFWWAGRRFGFNHQGDDRTNKELLSESGRLKHVINASVYTHVPHMEIFDYIWLFLYIPYSTWTSLYIP